MNNQWFYALADGRQQAGPVGDAVLADLVRAGSVGAGTLVWRRGMPAWQPYAEVWAALQQQQPAQPQLQPTPDAVTGLTTTTAGNHGGRGAVWARCVDCYGVFPADEVVTLHEGPVCARCKPYSLQRLREGVPARTSARYAGFWIRLGAAVLDYFIKLPVQIVAQVVLGFLPQIGYGHRPGILMAGSGLLLLFNLAFYLGYEIFFVGRFAATPGKMVCGLRVVRADGSRVTYGRATGRVFAKWLSSLTLCIGYVMAGFDEQKRALHDHLADTRVVYK